MKLRTIGLINTLVLGLVAGPLPADAQQSGKVYRIGRPGHKLEDSQGSRPHDPADHPPADEQGDQVSNGV